MPTQHQCMGRKCTRSSWQRCGQQREWPN